ncbi:alpha/beta hydrolase [Subtercola endophyticus]|uniref:alpha/beta hydrolase n=1 Tax=Subtercola endophyticus TaxID=2895559 RepID=UPI001E613D87|nr:alpha/beta hydrolase [Subtercola endophyticus]UFS60822.1 alpha/beta hydrolase [Subtercola endophyticus]
MNGTGDDAASMPAPPLDPELRAGLAIVGGVFPPTVTPELVPFMRRSYASMPYDQIVGDRPIIRTDHTLNGWQGAEIEASVLRPRGEGRARPVILFLHSGGLMFGDRFSGIDLAVEWITRFDCALVTVEYRLAPEHRHPVPFEDCYAALAWLHAAAAELGFDADRIVVAGASAGAGLAAGVALAARDRGGPHLSGLLLDYPMLDDRGTAHSLTQFDGIGVWDRISNETGWTALLGDARGTDGVSPYAAPARAEDLSGLPPTFIDVGSVEVFRDEATEFATRLWRDGNDAELHVWAGGFHAFDIFAPHTRLARGMIRARNDWLERILSD